LLRNVWVVAGATMRIRVAWSVVDRYRSLNANRSFAGTPLLLKPASEGAAEVGKRNKQGN
jgi:hypothetical protein